MLPTFEIAALNDGALAVNDHGRTVATITRRGYVDWLLISPLQDGPLVQRLAKETHLSWVCGLKFNLTCPSITTAREAGTQLVGMTHRVENGGSRLILVGEGVLPDGTFASRTEAVLEASADGSRYEWSLHTIVTNTGDLPRQVSEVEFNNILPALAYRGILHPGQKEFDRTLMQDLDGVVWEFPHQHALHYGKKIARLRFGTASWSGFFGSQRGCPVVVVTASDLRLDWGICDMYYDLHCCARGPHTFPPRGQVGFRYQIKYLSAAVADAWSHDARRIPINDEDRAQHEHPRFDLGLNQFDSGVMIDRPDEGCWFTTHPPERVWDRQTGHRSKGSLRLTSAGETLLWCSELPFHVVNGTRLNVRARVRLKDVGGNGFHIRLRHYTFCWNPAPDFYPIKTVACPPLSGTIDQWTLAILPELEIPAGEVEDGLLRLDLVLDGPGVAWVTDLDLEMEPAELALQESRHLVTAR